MTGTIVSLAFDIVVNLASLRCSFPADPTQLPICTAAIDGRTVNIDPTTGREVCVGKACAGCNTADDVGSEKFYLECYVCWGDYCCGATCTANEGWHCVDDGCS